MNLRIIFFFSFTFLFSCNKPNGLSKDFKLLSSNDSTDTHVYQSLKTGKFVVWKGKKIEDMTNEEIESLLLKMKKEHISPKCHITAFGNIKDSTELEKVEGKYFCFPEKKFGITITKEHKYKYKIESFGYFIF